MRPLHPEPPIWEKSTVFLNPTGIEVECEYARGATEHLCIAKITVALWTVTHVSSGLKFSDFVAKYAAREALLAAAPLTDWSLTGEQLRAKLGNDLAFLERLKRAVGRRGGKAKE